MSGFTKEEVERWRKKRGKDHQEGGTAAPQFECVHCHRAFGIGQGNAEVPICDWCLHRD